MEQNFGKGASLYIHDDGVVAVKWSDDIEYMGVLPLDYDQYDWCDDHDEDVTIMDDEIMQNDD